MGTASGISQLKLQGWLPTPSAQAVEGPGRKASCGERGPSAVAIRMPRAWQVHSGPQGFPLKANTCSWFSLLFLQTESLSLLVYSQSGCPVDPRSRMVCEKLSFPCRLFVPNRRQRFAPGLSFSLLLAHTALLPLTSWQTTSECSGVQSP